MLIKYLKLLILILISIHVSIQPVFADEPPKPSADGDVLIEAIEQNDAVKVDELLSMKIDPNSRGNKNKYMSPLKIAAKNNNRHMVESLIKHGADVKEQGILCFSVNSAEIVELLITHGADINAATCAGKSPIHAAIDSEALESADMLRHHGADINDQNNMSKRTPLHSAALYGKTKSVKWLLEHSADVNRPDSQGKTAILIGPSHKGNVEIIKMLLDSGAKLTSQDIPTLTQEACRAGNLEILDFLNSKGIKPDYDACYTALAFLPSPNQEVLRWAIGKAPIKNIEVGKESLLNIAVEHKNFEITKLLIASGADVNKKDHYNSTPLACAIEGMGNSRNETDNFKEMILLLLKHGADPNIKYGHKYAADNTKILLNELAAGVGCITKEQARFSEILNKEMSRKVEIAELLISFGADVNAYDPNGKTPLHIAAENNGVPMIKTLVSHGADLKAANKSGETPLHFSIIYGGNDMSCKLLTIETLCSLEANQGGRLDWARIKEVANRRYIQNKQPILTLINELEKNPSVISPGIKERVIVKSGV